MIRIIDMDDEAGAFAIFDTVTERFLADRQGAQVWDCPSEIDGLEDYYDRIVSLLRRGE